MFRGISTSMPRRLCSRAPATRIARGCGCFRRLDGSGIARSPRMYLAVSDCGSSSRASNDPAWMTRPPCSPAPSPRSTTTSAVRMVSASCSTTSTVLPWSRSCRRMAMSRSLSRGWQADRRLVEHVEGADEGRAQRRRQVDALRLAAPRASTRGGRGSGSRGPRRAGTKAAAVSRAPAGPRRPARRPLRARSSKKAAASPTVRAHTSSMVRPATCTPRASGRRRVPSQPGHVT